MSPTIFHMIFQHREQIKLYNNSSKFYPAGKKIQTQTYWKDPYFNAGFPNKKLKSGKVNL